MFGLQTLTCLHDIPVVRASTDKLQDVYAKAKDTSVLIRLPCNLAETVADKSLRVALTIVNPLVKPFSGPVRVIDDYAAQKLRQIESKYPVINTRTEDVVNTFNEKTEPVRHAINSVKDTTTSTIQQGKETVSNVASATVNKASGVADSVYSFCESRVPGISRRNPLKSQGFTGCLFSKLGSLYTENFQSIQSTFLWFRMLVLFFLHRIKQINDVVLKKTGQVSFLPVLSQRLLIFFGTFLDYFIRKIEPNEQTLAELKKPKQQSRVSQQQYYPNRQSVKSNPPVTTRQSVVVTKQETTVTRTSNSNQYPQTQPDYSNLTDKEELYARLAHNDLTESTYNIDNVDYTTEPVDLVENGDIAQLHARINPSDVELLYSRLPTDILPETDNDQPLTRDQQQLHARIIADELENQGYPVNDDNN
jgi:hypothetical protein